MLPFIFILPFKMYFLALFLLVFSKTLKKCGINIFHNLPSKWCLNFHLEKASVWFADPCVSKAHLISVAGNN